MSVARKRIITKLETNYALQQEVAQLSTARRKKLLFRRLTVFFIAASVLSFMMISTLLSQSSTLEKKINEKEKLSHELSGLKKQEEMLKEEVVKLHDDDYLAKLARKDYFLSEKGEIIFSIPEKKAENK
ncbi:septum formation initiator family protein [Bacillus sp. 03113]|uniref:FtsB family cell division protein n=1 Tax=Bacillus sp. 03113 TaxID=2578211 RepID=UPI0011445D4E|nr:septum formation initiator family protein [Bacillus sp. 03113]